MNSYLGLIKEYGIIHKKKTRITIICIAIAVCLVTAIFGLAEAMIQAQTIGQIKANGYWHVAFKNIDDETSSLIQNHTEIEVAGWLSSTQEGILGTEAIAIMGGDEAISGNMGLTVNNGRFPRLANEALLDEHFVKELGISLYDTVKVVLSDGSTHDFVITGTYNNTPLQLKDDTHGLFLSYDGIRKISSGTSGYTYYVQFKSGANMRNAIDTIKEDFNLSDEQVSENPALLGLTGQSRDSFIVSTYIIAVILFILVLAAGTLMIASSINMSVRERVQFFGLLRCLGASTSQVKKYVLLESIRLCLFGIPIGLIVGTVITIASSAFLRYINSAYFSDMPIFDLSLISLVSGTLVGFLTVTLAALSPANKAAKVSPQNAVSGNAAQNTMFTTKAAWNIKRIKPETSLGISHAFSDKKNIILMTGSFAISIILFLSFSVMVDFMGQGIRALKPYTPDISIASSDNSNSLDKKILKQAQNISGVKRAFGRMFEDVSITSVYGDAKISLISYEENQFKWAKQELVSGNIDTVINKNNTVLVVYSDNSNLHVGDTFTIKTAHGKNTVYVAGVLSNSPFVNEADIQTVICSEQTFQGLTEEQGYSVIDTQLARNASEDTVTQLRRLTSSEQIFSDRREVNTGAKAAYYSFALFIYGFLVIIASITVFNIINSMSNSVSNRKNRYGVMKAIGMTGGQLHHMVIVEAATYAICGCLAGLIISLPIHRLIFQMLITSKWGLNWQVPFGTLAIIIGITILSTVLSVIRPVKTLNKMSVTDIVNAQ
ncbi:ABC transporter permease [Anaerocolumna sp. MB42-C2]|uniref:ABC transporter permease n=1 Tax=Anaerocolumna sp. MB42-C2 TaxID=3070997 RepID=UPI0027E15FA7|nr:FtsX-like permease family protein [Anaerocolumna sp. MB42-C2]WMJ89669.1 FtsX-like permease family protein [Anaerocolumna sp. MB42-C2]